jgi:hypothetical protein
MSLTVTGGHHLISEVAEQIAWLAATLRLSPRDRHLVGVCPRMSNLRVGPPTDVSTGERVCGSCQLSFDIEDSPSETQNDNGLCWAPLFTRSILVCGFPTLRRSVPQTGLEISLKAMASLVRSTQVIRYEHRLIMKGFNSLLVATSLQSGVVLWHALTSSAADQRVSYFDPRIDQFNTSHRHKPTLRVLERARHIIGWCSPAIDFCG